METWFQGVLPAYSSVEIVYPGDFSLNEDAGSPCQNLVAEGSCGDLDCQVTIGSTSYPSTLCFIDAEDRTISIEGFLRQDLDFIDFSGGEHLTFQINDQVLINPTSSKPVEEAF